MPKVFWERDGMELWKLTDSKWSGDEVEWYILRFKGRDVTQYAMTFESATAYYWNEFA